MHVWHHLPEIFENILQNLLLHIPKYKECKKLFHFNFKINFAFNFKKKEDK